MSEQKVALVTGASRGIGRACATALARDGFRVAIHYRSGREGAEALQRELPGAEIFAADVSSAEQCQDLIKAVKEKMGRIDVLVNNAGMCIDQVLTFAKPEDFETLLNANVRSVFLLSKAASRHMIKQKGGRIVNITSVVGHTGNGGQSMYAATKGAIGAFTKSIAVDLAGFNILANCVAPGFIDTDMTSALPPDVKEKILQLIPLKRLGRPEEVADAVSFLASDRATFITGSTIHVNGGQLPT